jgi:FMN phosphatase YigB (HAD superfamily)
LGIALLLGTERQLSASALPEFSDGLRESFEIGKGTMEKFIIVDLDGTICDCSHRIAFAQSKEWDEFHARLMDDRPNADVVDIVMKLASRMSIIVLTGRDERFAEPTRRWLRKNGIIVDALIMRPEGDYTPDHELKPRLLFEHFKSKEEALRNVSVILDDRDKVVAAFRDHGFPCWQVREGTY